METKELVVKLYRYFESFKDDKYELMKLSKHMEVSHGD